MSGSGVGRGRGWLHASRNTEAKPTKPGISSPTEPQPYDPSIVSPSVVNPSIVSNPSAPLPNQKYAELIAQYLEFDKCDSEADTTLKYNLLVLLYQNACKSSDDVMEALMELHDQCLNNDDYAERISKVIFTKKLDLKIHNVKTRTIFINEVQKDFDNATTLKLGNAKQFRNSVRLVNGLFHSNMHNERLQRNMSRSVALQLHLLLKVAQNEDCQLFTYQLYMNGPSIKEHVPKMHSNLLLEVRSNLMTNKYISSTGRAWLLLALDLSQHRCMILPNDLQQFYMEQLGKDEFLRLKEIDTWLSVETGQTDFADVHSDVSVLQVKKWLDGCSLGQPPAAEPKPEQPALVPPQPQPQPAANCHAYSQMQNIGTWQAAKAEKTPRPILGAGHKLNGTKCNPEEPQDAAAAADKPEADWIKWGVI